MSDMSRTGGSVVCDKILNHKLYAADTSGEAVVQGGVRVAVNPVVV